ncbi:sensor histidine kinase [Nesterenkonia haasae]|uniref:sensor histidine kinase n=1 Tax=Nesterenkonia haasae TaxID=2587813 RepID=UPI001390C78A|nr:histidine kinase [Nesterenkonia haasae]NDK31216.1 hypothetical protein [Nesterenkonia haasae]
MPQSAQGPAQSLVEEFEAGGYWSYRTLNKGLLVVVTLGFGITLGVEVLYEVVASEEFSPGPAVAGLMAVACVILLWMSLTIGVTAGLAILALALFIGHGMFSIVLALLLTGLAALATTKRFRRGTLAVMLLWAGAYSVMLDDLATAGLSFAGISGGVLVAYGIGSAFRRATNSSLQSSRNLEEVEARHAVATSAERRSIARDLHDIVAHDITIIAMQSRAAQVKDTDEAYREAVEVIGNSSRVALNDLRRMLAVLKDDQIPDEAVSPLTSASELDVRVGAEVFAEELESLGITVHLSIDGDLDSLTRSVSAALYRMLQECTTNAAKFAGRGAECWIAIEVTDEHVSMSVTNTVLVPERSLPGWGESGAGLRGMQDRAEAFGGVMTSGYDDQDRWEVRVTGIKKS